jgi:L-aminopeptidase/D-esterase-like protein
MTVLGALAAEVTARAVLSAIHHASGLPGLPAARDFAPAV